MTDMQALIARLEAATGPDRELDAAIDMVRLNLRGAPSTPVYFDGYDKGNWRDTVGLLRTSLAYTASIDAALTLVPDDCTVSINIDRDGRADATIESGWDAFVGYAPTPALAIVIAALKARGA